MQFVFDAQCWRMAELSQKQQRNSAQNFSLINRIAFNSLKSCKLGIKGRRIQAGWDNDYMLLRCVGPGVGVPAVAPKVAEVIKCDPIRMRQFREEVRNFMKPATTVEKVCRVLSVLRGKPALGVTEVAEEATLLPSDAHRILNSLRAFGFVDQNISTKKYHLGLELLKLGHSVHMFLDLGEIAKPRMRRLSEMATAVSNLAILDGQEGDVIFVEQVDSPSDFQVRLRIGSHASRYATAVGKMLTAHQDPATVLRILEKCKIRKNTKRTITDTDKLCAEFKKIRVSGYATDSEESIEGAYCISAPVYSYNREVIAALSISTLAARVASSQESSLIKMVRSTAAMISADLGYKAMLTTFPVVSRKALSKKSATY